MPAPAACVFLCVCVCVCVCSCVVPGTVFPLFAVPAVQSSVLIPQLCSLPLGKFGKECVCVLLCVCVCVSVCVNVF